MESYPRKDSLTDIDNTQKIIMKQSVALGNTLFKARRNLKKTRNNYFTL